MGSAWRWTRAASSRAATSSGSRSPGWGRSSTPSADVRGRLLFALGFVVLVSALIVLRDHGYLGGREIGGPLELTVADTAREVDRAQLGRFRIKGAVDSAVLVQNARPRVRSPELGVIKTHEGHPLEDSVLESADPGSTDQIVPIVVSLRAVRAG